MSDISEVSFRQLTLKILLSFFFCVALILSILVFWIQSGTITAIDARLEEDLVPVASRISEKVHNIFVEVGEPVREGEKIAMLRSNALEIHACDYDPGFGEHGVAAGIENLREKLIIASHEESRAASLMRESVAAHARAHFLVREVVARGGTPTAQMLDSEQKARVIMEMNKKLFENVSTERAHLSAQVETAWQKFYNSENAQKEFAQATTQQIVERLLTVVSPIDGVIARISTRLGDEVSRGQTIVEILPKSNEPSSVTVWMQPDSTGVLEAGQPCVLTVAEKKRTLGHITRILPVENHHVVQTALRGKDIRGKIGTESQKMQPVVVQAKFDTPVLPDEAIACTVYTHNFKLFDSILPILP